MLISDSYIKFKLILKGCLQGLAFLYKHRMVYTDIKPPNIGLKNLFLDKAGEEANVSTQPL